MLAPAVPASEVIVTTCARPSAYTICPSCGYVGEINESTCIRYRCFEPICSYGQLDNNERAPTRLWSVRRRGNESLFFPPQYFGRVRAERGSRRVKEGVMQMQKRQATPTFPPPGQEEGLEGRNLSEVRGSYRGAGEYQIRLLDRLLSPLRESVHALERVQAMKLVAEVEQLALEELVKTAPDVARLVNASERSSRQLCEALLTLERNIVRLVEG